MIVNGYVVNVFLYCFLVRIILFQALAVACWDAVTVKMDMSAILEGALNVCFINE